MHREAPSGIPAAMTWVDRPDAGDGPVSVLPDGCMDLMWVGGELLVCGADTTARTVGPTPGTRVGLRFAPGHLPRWLGRPAAELVDARVPLAELVVGGARDRARRAADDLADHPTPAVLERLAQDLGAAAVSAPVEDEIARRARRGQPVGAMAADLGFSTRQLLRRSRDAFGYGPKVLTRVLRLQHVVALGERGLAPAAAAATAGYADQAHLARDVRALTGTTWTALLQSRQAPAASETGASDSA